MQQYIELGKKILNKGRKQIDRTGVGTISLFGEQLRFDLKEKFPLLTTKKVFTRGLIEELLWIIKGSTNNNELTDKNVHIWDKWALEDKHKVSKTYQELLEEINTKENKDDLLTQLETIIKSMNNSDDNDFENYSKVMTWAVNQGISVYIKIVIKDINDRIRWASNHLDSAALESLYEKIDSWGKVGLGQELLEVKISEVCDDFNIPTIVNKDGELGPIYGKQWRDFSTGFGKGVDQLAELIHGLKTKPFSRRHIISAWNPVDLPDESISPQENVKLGKMSLAPCHCLVQFRVSSMTNEERLVHATTNGLMKGYIEDFKKLSEAELLNLFIQNNVPDKYLDCQLYQRSADYPVGVPFNIASYALFTHMVAQVTGMVANEFIHTFGDVHVYLNQIDNFKIQLEREPMKLPTLKLNKEVKNIFDFTINDITIEDYKSHAKIDYEVAV